MNHLKKSVTKDPMNILLICFLAVFIASTWKYAKDGDVYIFQTQTTDEFVDLKDRTVTQEIAVDEIADWKDGSYSVYFHFEGEAASNESICLELSDGSRVIDTASVPVRWLKEGFNELKWINFSKLDAGLYQLAIGGSPSLSVRVGLCDNVYNLPNCYVDGEDSGLTLAQAYHYNFASTPYKAGIALFLLLVALCVFTTFCVSRKGEDASGMLRITLIATYIILAYEYDSGFFYQPLVGEAVTIFMHNSFSQSWWSSLYVPDAGYLPLFQRLISVFVFNFLNMTPYVGVYVLQIAAYVLTGVIISFFAKRQFSSVLDIRMRWVISIILMLFGLNSETLYQTSYFINFIVYGVYVFFLYFLVDSRAWSRREYVAILAWVFIQCMSKGVNVTLLPLSILCLIMFYRSYSRRDRAVLFSCALGALFQLVYYFGYGMHHSGWTYPQDDAGGEWHYLKQLIGILVDTPNWLLSLLKDNVAVLNGFAIPIIVAFWIFLGYIFVKNVLCKLFNRQPVSRGSCAFFMAVIYIMAQSLFLRIRVSGWGNDSGIASDAFWSFQNLGDVNRHTMGLFLAVITIYILIMHGLATGSRGGRRSVIAFSAILIAVSISNPRMHIRGFWDDEYVRESSVTAFNDSEAILLKGIKEAECRVVPMMQYSGWKYSKNASCYCFGENVLEWDAALIDADEPQKGSLVLDDCAEVDNSVPIWQVFVYKNCLVDADAWSVILYDEQGNVLLRQEQDNAKYQKIASFTFGRGIPNIGRIQVVDHEGNSICMENAIYLVTKAGESLVDKGSL